LHSLLEERNSSHKKMTVLLSFTQPHAVSWPYAFVLFVEQTV